MKRVTGLGGIFIKTPDVKRMRAWYAKHLGIPFHEHFDGWVFEWGPKASGETGQTLFTLFPTTSDYFNPSPAPFMVNFRVDDITALVAALQAEGVKVEPVKDEGEYGKFAWCYDPDGNKIELWEPPAG